MGATGAGKTTLMDVLAGRKTQGLIRGSILVNGHEKDQSTWVRLQSNRYVYLCHSQRCSLLRTGPAATCHRMQTMIWPMRSIDWSAPAAFKARSMWARI